MGVFRRLLHRAATCSLAAACLSSQAPGSPARGREPADPVQFVFTADAHYGLNRPSFRGDTNVQAQLVNRALVAAINALPETSFPIDGGLRSGQRIGTVDFVVEGGDVTNRAEGAGPSAIQSAAASWSQFVADYVDGLTLRGRDGERAPLFVVPGNHEASNAVGFYKPMAPPIDKTPMVEIYNRMVGPVPRKTRATFDYARDRVLYAKNIGGIRFEFQQVWPDTIGRAWMERDLASVSDRAPVVIFVHDQPDAEAKHFRNPNPPFTINPVDQFENILADTFQDGKTVATESIAEQTALEAFLRKHKNITAYFHGNSNWNQFYEWGGPQHSIALHVFRVDSPIKGKDSASDEAKLSFQVATIDPSRLRMTVRECLWNQGARVRWGTATTVALGAPFTSTRD